MNQQPPVPSEIITLLKEREGFRTVVYLDSLGVSTVGLGHKLLPSELHLYPIGSTVPEDILNGWMGDDTMGAYVAAKSQARQIGLNDPRLINALAVVSFQLGDFWYKKFPKAWAFMLVHQWPEAVAEIRDSLWDKQTPVRTADFIGVLRSFEPPAIGTFPGLGAPLNNGGEHNG